MIHERQKPHDVDAPTDQELDDYYSEQGYFNLVRPSPPEEDSLEQNTDATGKD